MEASGIRIIYYRDKNAEFSFYDIADIHFLNRGCSKIHVKKDVDRIQKDPLAYFAIGGDYGDFINVSDKRFDASAFDTELKVNDLNILGSKIVELMREYYSPISDRCIGVLWGNHDKKYLSIKSQETIHNEVCDQLNAPNMGYSGFVDIYFVHNPRMPKPSKLIIAFNPPEKFTAKLRIFIHHGSGAANTAGGKINRLKAFVDMVDADLVMMGHVHEQMAKQFLRLLPNHDCTEIGQKVTMGLITGSYLKTYAPDFTGYGEIAGYAPAALGATRARYIPAEMSLTVENRGENVGTRGNQ